MGAYADILHGAGATPTETRSTDVSVPLANLRSLRCRGSCLAPQDLGVLSDSGTAAQVTDNIAPATDVDWYKFTALDGADPNSCDSFDVRISFIYNPQGRFAFDVFEGGCETSKDL